MPDSHHQKRLSQRHPFYRGTYKRTWKLRQRGSQGGKEGGKGGKARRTAEGKPLGSSSEKP
jgi:hypothetical protein